MCDVWTGCVMCGGDVWRGVHVMCGGGAWMCGGGV